MLRLSATLPPTSKDSPRDRAGTIFANYWSQDASSFVLALIDGDGAVVSISRSRFLYPPYRFEIVMLVVALYVLLRDLHARLSYSTFTHIVGASYANPDSSRIFFSKQLPVMAVQKLLLDSIMLSRSTSPLFTAIRGPGKSWFTSI
jgi:hypothetical protein